VFSTLKSAICSAACLFVVAGPAEGASGPVAEWTFDEGQGSSASDASDNRQVATLVGPTWAKQGSGYALVMDGHDDYVECGDSANMNISGPVSVEAWIKPMRKAHGETGLVGTGMQGFQLTYYNTEISLFYIGSGGNNIKGQLALHQWNHVAVSFDGERLTMWINGRQKGGHASKHKTYRHGGPVVIGTKGRSDLPKFKGLLDNVRIYNRALEDSEVSRRFLAEASEHDFDPQWFSRVKVKPYYDFDRNEIAIEADYKWLQPLQGRAALEVTLAAGINPDVIIERAVLDPVPTRWGIAEVTLPFNELASGNYVLATTLSDDHGAYPVEQFNFSYPPKPVRFPLPAEKMAGPLPAAPKHAPFRFKMGKLGGFNITINGRKYPFRSRISWPGGDFNHLGPGTGRPRGEQVWQVAVKSAGKDKFVANARGSHYTVGRAVEVFPTHVYVKDKITNTTGKDLGLLIYHETPVRSETLTSSLLSGYERRGRQADLTYPDYAPSTWFTDDTIGMGIVPTDDVFILQAVPYVDWQETAGLATEQFALAPGKSYTLEWSIYPTGSKDYYDFVNNFRRAENRIGTVNEAPGFVTGTPHPPARRDLVDADFMDKRNIQVGIMHSLSEVEDDKNLHVEGVELFREFPQEMELIRQQIEGTQKVRPGFKVIQHIAHSIYTTSNTEQFADSRVINEDGTHATWGDGSAFGTQRQSEGYRWWIFYPMPGNSFHKAMMESIDTMMDHVGLGGAFLDGFLAGYGGMWTHDRWDGHSAVMDLGSKTIIRKRASVMLLSQPSMIEYARKIRAKGGVVVALHAVFTRSICNENYIHFANESASGPELHLAPTVSALGGNTGFSSLRHIYLDILDKLSWGELYIHYTDGHPLTHRSLASHQYPITFEEIRSGMVRGPERIVTMNSGVYAWPGDNSLHAIHAFDERGVPAANKFLTTIDTTGVRTELEFEEHESAVIVPIPATLDTASVDTDTVVNTRVASYDVDGLNMLLSGQGAVTLKLNSGAFPIESSASYDVSISGTSTTIQADGPMLVIPLELAGVVELVVGPAR
jgi:hypothetical protein